MTGYTLNSAEMKKLVENVKQIETYIRKEIMPRIHGQNVSVKIREDKRVWLEIRENDLYIGTVEDKYPFSEENSFSHRQTVYGLYAKYPENEFWKVSYVMIDLITNWKTIKSEIMRQIEDREKLHKSIMEFTV